MNTPIPSRRSVLLGTVTAGTVTVLGMPSAFAGGGTLRRGSRGQQVTDLQNRLNSLGYWCGRADGRFGASVQQAVYALQKAAGLSRDGRVGPKTRQALDAGVRPSNRVSDGIEIDLDRQLLIASRGGSIRWILNTSTGSGERYDGGKIATTPRGSFKVYRTVSRGWRTAPLGRLYRPAYFTGGYAVHGATSIPPRPASHGCARVSVGAMNMLWDEGFTRKGTGVKVY